MSNKIVNWKGGLAVVGQDEHVLNPFYVPALSSGHHMLGQPAYSHPSLICMVDHTVHLRRLDALVKVTQLHLCLGQGVSLQV